MKKTTNDLSVGLLFKDISDARDISKVFKKIGIHPYFYSDLKSFWTESLETKPSLCIVDVRMMSGDSLVLKNHPYLKQEDMSICFFYNEKSAPLLFSTFDIFHLGLIKSASSYAGQVKSILKRFNKMNTLEIKERELSVSNRRLHKKVEKLIINTEKVKEKNSHYQYLVESVQKINDLKSSESFEEATADFFQDFPFVKTFGMMELSHNSQKLVTSECFSSKFKKIPTLWLGKTCRNGIEAFAQALATQVVMELLDGSSIILNIEGIKEHPERLLYLEVDDADFLEGFDWIGLERNISALYNYFYNKENQKQHYQRESKNSFELLSFLDSFSFGKYPDGRAPKGFNEEDYLLINMDLSNLLDLATVHRSKGRFYWEEFYSDFFIRLSNVSKSDFKTTPMGVSNIAILVERLEDEDFFEKLKTFAFRYPYWRYFEDADMILSRSMKPEFKISPFSTKAYLDLLGGLEKTDDKKRSKSMSKERSYYVPGIEQRQ